MMKKVKKELDFILDMQDKGFARGKEHLKDASPFSFASISWITKINSPLTI